MGELALGARRAVVLRQFVGGIEQRKPCRARASLPLIFTPASGSTIVRVWTIGLQRARLRRPAQVEDVLAFEEERPLLREEERRTQVDVHLAGVGLDLAEVGVVGAVRGQLRGDAVLGGDAEAAPSDERASRPDCATCCWM